MLELPESYVIASQVEAHLKGKIIRNVEVLHTPHKFAFFKSYHEPFANDLIGEEVVGAVYHGGMVEIDLKESRIAFADGAYPKYYDDKSKFPKKHQMAIYFEDDTAMFVSIQMYGEIFVYPIGKCDDPYYLSASGKPSPLTKEFTYDYFKGLYSAVSQKKKITAKAFLATEQRIPGLGNGVLQDILWDAGIDPRCEVKEDSLQVLYQSVTKMLAKMVQDGGRDTEKTMFGEKGGYVTQLRKKSLYEPCMKCGHEIQRASYMGGTIYFCEHCQRR